MKILLSLGCIFSVALGEAASVLWNEGIAAYDDLVMVDGVAWWDFTISATLSEYDSIYKEFSILICENEVDKSRILYAGDVDIFLPCRFILSEQGDEIGSSTIGVKEKTFLDSMLYVNRDEWVVCHYATDSQWKMYLGFVVISSNSGKNIYGWMELFVDDYTLTLKQSCIDLSGRPVIVGVRPEEPIPEPATGALALLGAAMLFRQRRRPWRNAEHNEARSA